MWQTPRAYEGALPGNGSRQSARMGGWIMPRRLTQEEFVLKARQVHGMAFDYDRVEYVNAATKVTIGCPSHGYFEQRAQSHLDGKGCVPCSRSTASARTISEKSASFVDRARAVHGEAYTYDRLGYRGTQCRVTITCAKHGDFEQFPSSHLSGSGCNDCWNARRGIPQAGERLAAFVQAATERHAGTYSYEQSVYVNRRTPLIVICQTHGAFAKTPAKHLAGEGCPKCSAELRRRAATRDTETFVALARSKHGDTYDYSKCDYRGTTTKVIIGCAKHGDFSQTPDSHLNNRSGCPRCAQDLRNADTRVTQEEFLERARTAHGDAYSYDRAVYVSMHSPVVITCPVHGDFTRLAVRHVGRDGAGCPDCRGSRGESLIARALEAAGVAFEREYWTPELRDVRPLRFDFALPTERVLIEFDGVHHRFPTRYGGMSEEQAVAQFEATRERDRAKDAWAASAGWTVLRIAEGHRVVADLRAAGVLGGARDARASGDGSCE